MQVTTSSSSRGRGESFSLDILFHGMSVTAISQLQSAKLPEGGNGVKPLKRGVEDPTLA
jgi:hypothetical protein